MEIKTKEKTCIFYASDYHFEMISIPYIIKNIDSNKEIIILTENNLEATVNNLVKKMNLEENKKKKILKLNWKNEDLIKFKEINKKSKEKREIIIFIKGKQNYIKNVNKNIEKWISGNNNIKTVDCYEFFEVEKEMEELAKSYDKILGIYIIKIMY